MKSEYFENIYKVCPLCSADIIISAGRQYSCSKAPTHFLYYKSYDNSIIIYFRILLMGYNIKYDHHNKKIVLTYKDKHTKNKVLEFQVDPERWMLTKDELLNKIQKVMLLI